MSLSSLLSRARKDLGLTQAVVAEAVGVDASTYTCWEGGTRTPRLGQLPGLARVLNLNATELGQAVALPAEAGIDLSQAV